MALLILVNYAHKNLGHIRTFMTKLKNCLDRDTTK